MLDNSFSAVQKVSSGGSLRRLNPYTKIRIMHFNSKLAGLIFNEHPDEVVQVTHLVNDWIAVEFCPFKKDR